MEIETVKKTYLVKFWDITLNGGRILNEALREDQGDSFAVEIDDEGRRWWKFSVPAQKRISRFRVDEIAAYNYSEAEHQEVPAYDPKKKKPA